MLVANPERSSLDEKFHRWRMWVSNAMKPVAIAIECVRLGIKVCWSKVCVLLPVK